MLEGDKKIFGDTSRIEGEKLKGKTAGISLTRRKYIDKIKNRTHSVFANERRGRI